MARPYDSSHRQGKRPPRKTAEQLKEYNRVYHRNHDLKRKYGITWEDKCEMYQNQKGCCAACDELSLSITKMHVHHDHKTGKVLHLLCRNCNISAGHLGDSSERAFKLAEYLRKVETDE